MVVSSRGQQPHEEAGMGADTTQSAAERVVISGMSGLYPSAHNVLDLADILYNKINPITSDNSRWIYEHPEVVPYIGKAPDLKYFDAQFFKVHYRLGHNMDAMGRKILEQTYQAIYDAGVSPEQLSGKKVGVYIGTCFSETEKICFYVASSRTGFGIAGCSKTMFANRISYWLDVKGPSMSVDQACNSSTAAVELAYQAIRSGECEAAIVGGTNLCLHPHSSVHYGRIVKLSKDGKTKSFDENADGFAKSDTINVLFLQKAKDALRVYAEILHVKSEFTAESTLHDDTGIKYGFCRDPKYITDFLKRFYEEAKVPPQAVEYVEACGSASSEADKSELIAYENIFCNDRSEPLLVGSVMSNIGYGEAASGITAITKVLLGYHTGSLAANLHCETPRRDVAALRDGRMRVVREHAPFRRSYAAVNGLSVTGANAHVLLHGHYKPKNLSRYKSDVPYLVLVSGRQETAVKKILDYVKSRPVDPEELALLNNIHITRISGNLGRGFTILDETKGNGTISLCEKVEYFDYVKRPLWFVYSGMGSQWAGMGTALMRIPIFAAAIERCHRVLQLKGLDIVHIITTPDKSVFDNILHSFVGIAAIQIGLTDILRELGLEPDKIIGHSVGELGCAYADGCFTAEEMIMSAYSRGLVSLQTPVIHGSMAAVGIGYKEIVSMCPPEIDVACHNGPDSCTISGPADALRKFVTKLVSKNIFAKEVQCSNIAYHSRYIAAAGPKLLERLREVIKSPKARSERWLSTSVPMDKWKEDSAKYSSAEYHTNNLLNSVLFEETCGLIPADAVLVEVAPHGLLQAILNRSLPTSCKNIALTRRGSPDNAVFFLEAIGKLYVEGFNPCVQTLYPKIDFPVSTGTPMLSHLVEWAHHEKWVLPLYVSARHKSAAAAKYLISVHDDEHAYLQGHVVNGKVLYPFSAALVAVWDTLAMTLGAARRRLAVLLHDVELHAQPVLHERRQLRLAVALHRGTGRFEVVDDINSKVASGFIKQEIDYNFRRSVEVETKDFEISSKEIYNNFLLRDVCYKDLFQSIHSVNATLTEARVLWRDNWVTFIDGMIQLNTLIHSHESYSQPLRISNLSINPVYHYKNCSPIMRATVLETHGIARCGGIVMENITFHDIPLSTVNSTKLRALRFMPHFGTHYDMETIFQVYLQIVAENKHDQHITIMGVYENQSELSKFNEIIKILEGVLGITTVSRCLKRNDVLEQPDTIFANVDLIVTFDLSTDNHIYSSLHRMQRNYIFIMNIQENVHNISNTTQPHALYQVVCGHRVESTYIELARWRPNNTSTVLDTCIVTVLSHSDFALLSSKRDSLLPHQTLLILTTHPVVPGLKDFVIQLKKKPGCEVRLVMTYNEVWDGIDAESLITADLSFQVLKNNVIGGEYYSTVRDAIEGPAIVDGILQRSLVGEMKSLHWIQKSPQDSNGVTVEVHFAAFNNLDLKRATGLIPFDNYNKQSGFKEYGMDFSGVTESGARVMGLVYNGSISTHVQAYPELLWPVPAHWSLEDAATVPLAYCLAYYCLTIRCELFPGMSVLIHGGAGALGQALISIAMANDCEVFTTVSDVRKKQFLLKLFPGLKADNIGNSRDSTFRNMVHNATKGNGVQVIVSCLNGELKNASMFCLSQSGCILDLSQLRNRESFYFGMYHLEDNKSYISVDIFSMFNEKENTTMKKLQQLVGEGIARGWVRPLSRVTYGPRDAPRALCLLAAGTQRGRVLLHTKSAPCNLGTEPRLQCSPGQCHVIVSDHECFAKQLTDKLVSRGARQIRLILRAPSSPKDFVLKIRQWQSIGAKVTCEALGDAIDVPKLFSESNSRGPVGGVYIVVTNRTVSVLESNSFIEKMDILTRNFFPNIKYFTVINTVNSAGEEICMSRTLSRFAGTMIRLPGLLELERWGDAGDERMSPRVAADAVERALASTEPILAAFVAPAARVSLLQQIATIADVNITKESQDTNTLLDLGMNSTKCNDVWVFLRNTHNVFLTMEEIQTLTVQRIKEIDETITWTDFPKEKGLQTFFSYVETDELLATTEIVFLSTQTTATVSTEESDVKQTHLCIVPGLEGNHARFREMCARLKLPALVLQPGLDRPRETVRELACRYTKVLLEKIDLKTNFYLLGYESGVLVALEMAAVLEEYGFSGTVFCIGLPPEEFKKELKEQLGGLDTDESLQDAVVRHMYCLMTGGHPDELEVALRDARYWQEKLEITVRSVMGRVAHSAQYARQLIEAAYGRIAALLQYEGEARALRSQLVLLQPRSRQPLIAHAATLQLHSLQPVSAHALRAPLAHATSDLRCAVFINAHLSPDILQAFNNKNLCETYILNVDSFRTTSEI